MSRTVRRHWQIARFVAVTSWSHSLRLQNKPAPSRVWKPAVARPPIMRHRGICANLEDRLTIFPQGRQACQGAGLPSPMVREPQVSIRRRFAATAFLCLAWLGPREAAANQIEFSTWLTGVRQEALSARSKPPTLDRA